MSFDLPTDEELPEVGKFDRKSPVVPNGYYSSVVTGVRKAKSQATQHMIFIGANLCTRYGDPKTVIDGNELSCMLMLPTWDNQQEFETALAEKFAENNDRPPTDEELAAAVKAAKARAWRQLASCGRALKGDSNLPEVPVKDGDQIKDKAGNVYTREQQEACVNARSKAALEFMRDVVDGKIKISGYYVYALTETSEYKGKNESRIRYFCDSLPAGEDTVPPSEWAE